MVSQLYSSSERYRNTDERYGFQTHSVVYRRASTEYILKRRTTMQHPLKQKRAYRKKGTVQALKTETNNKMKFNRATSQALWDAKFKVLYKQKEI